MTSLPRADRSRELSHVDQLWLNRVTSTNTKPEVVLSRSGGHVKNLYDVITQPQMAQFE